MKSIEQEIQEDIIRNTEFLNQKEIIKHEKELVESRIYLPKIIRINISTEYYSNIPNSVYKECAKTKNKTLVEDVKELDKWTTQNKDYQNLVHKDTLEKLIKQIDFIQNEKL